jgi:hypothetical protein
MTAAPSWTILVPTLGERRPLFERLMAGLLPQLDPYAGRVRVVGWHNDGRPPLPKIRQTMVETAASDYVSFVDDDDLVSPDYVDRIVAALETEPDYVGFQVQCYSDGAPVAVAYHSLEFTQWRNLTGRYERDISHINPIRRQLALRADFARTRSGGAEDRNWAAQLRRAQVLKTQVVIPHILYHYLFTSTGTRWQKPRAITPGQRSALASPHFTWSAHA